MGDDRLFSGVIAPVLTPYEGDSAGGFAIGPKTVGGALGGLGIVSGLLAERYLGLLSGFF